MTNGTVLVASPSAIGRQPEASGSSVPACPARLAANSRLTTLTACVDVMPTGLTSTSQPFTSRFGRLIVCVCWFTSGPLWPFSKVIGTLDETGPFGRRYFDGDPGEARYRNNCCTAERVSFDGKQSLPPRTARRPWCRKSHFCEGARALPRRSCRREKAQRPGCSHLLPMASCADCS